MMTLKRLQSGTIRANSRQRAFNLMDAQIWDGVVDFFHVWKKWSGTELGHEELLWGHHLYFWARIGKGLEFLAALTIVTDIIGPEKLRDYGKWLGTKRFSQIFMRLPERKKGQILIVVWISLSILFVIYLLHEAFAKHHILDLSVWGMIWAIVKTVLWAILAGVIAIIMLFLDGVLLVT